MNHLPAVLRITRMVCALLAACCLALFSANCAPALAQDSGITFKCDGANSTPSPNENTCWSVFKKPPGRIPTYNRVEISADNCKTSLRCWTIDSTASEKCKVIPVKGPVPVTSKLANCPK